MDKGFDTKLLGVKYCAIEDELLTNGVINSMYLKISFLFIVFILQIQGTAKFYQINTFKLLRCSSCPFRTNGTVNKNRSLESLHFVAVH